MQPFFEIKIFKLHFTVSAKFLKPNFSLHIIEFSVDTDQSFRKNVQCEVQLKFSKKSNIFISIISKGEKQSYILKVFAASNGFKINTLYFLDTLEDCMSKLSNWKSFIATNVILLPSRVLQGVHKKSSTYFTRP